MYGLVFSTFLFRTNVKQCAARFSLTAVFKLTVKMTVVRDRCTNGSDYHSDILRLNRLGFRYDSWLPDTGMCDSLLLLYFTLLLECFSFLSVCQRGIFNCTSELCDGE